MKYRDLGRVIKKTGINTYAHSCKEKYFWVLGCAAKTR